MSLPSGFGRPAAALQPSVAKENVRPFSSDAKSINLGLNQPTNPAPKHVHVGGPSAPFSALRSPAAQRVAAPVAGPLNKGMYCYICHG